MLIVILVIMATIASRSADAQTVLAPCVTGGEFPFVSYYTVDLGGHLSSGLSRETTDKEIIVNVATYNLTVSIVTQTAVGRAAARVGVTWNLCNVANQKHMSQVIVGVILVLDVGLEVGIG